MAGWQLWAHVLEEPSHACQGVIPPAYTKEGIARASCCHPQVAPHTLIVWRPDLHTYTAHLTHSLNSTAGTAHAKMNNADLPKVVGQGLGKAIQLWQEDVHVSCTA
jgi:hypothetical protein